MTKIQKTLIITHACIAFKINLTFDKNLPPVDLYDATRYSWRISTRREKAKYALAVYKGIVQEVYEIHSWLPQNTTFNTRLDYSNGIPQISTERFEFIGRLAPFEIRNKYKGEDIKNQLSARQDSDYLNC